jgi:hypothetical protein
MKAIQVSLSTLACLFLAYPQTNRAQAPDATHPSNWYSVSISMEKETVTPSQPPVVNLAIKNISDRIVYRDDCSSDPRVWVQGEHGEPPTTFRERFGTGRLLPGEAPLACTLNLTYAINPGETYTKHILLEYLYDLRQPGTYSVYVEYPTGEGFLRTNTATFHMVAEATVKEKVKPTP